MLKNFTKKWKISIGTPRNFYKKIFNQEQKFWPSLGWIFLKNFTKLFIPFYRIFLNFSIKKNEISHKFTTTPSGISGPSPDPIPHPPPCLLFHRVHHPHLLRRRGEGGPIDRCDVESYKILDPLPRFTFAFIFHFVHKHKHKLIIIVLVEIPNGPEISTIELIIYISIRSTWSSSKLIRSS